MRVGVLTISSSGAAGLRADVSGNAVSAWAGARLVVRSIVADDTIAIVRQLTDWCDNDSADLILTTGGTGLSVGDVTPEATRTVIEREAQGIAERIRWVTGQSFPRAALGRGISGIRARTLIINLPGSIKGVTDSLAAIDPIVEHAVQILRGEPTEHSPAER